MGCRVSQIASHVSLTISQTVDTPNLNLPCRVRYDAPEAKKLKKKCIGTRNKYTTEWYATDFTFVRHKTSIQYYLINYA